MVMTRAIWFKARNTEGRRRSRTVVRRMVFATLLTYSRVVAFRYIMAISLAIQTSSRVNTGVERKSTKREMYILGLDQRGKNSAWNLDKPITGRRISCVRPLSEGTESAGMSRWKKEIERGLQFFIRNPCG